MTSRNPAGSENSTTGGPCVKSLHIGDLLSATSLTPSDAVLLSRAVETEGRTASTADIEKHIKADVQALVELHSSTRGRFAESFFGPSRTGKLDNTFDVSLFSILERGGLRLLQSGVREATATGISFCPSVALAIVERTYSVLFGLWLAAGSLSAFGMLIANDSAEMRRLRGVLKNEVRRLIMSAGHESNSLSRAKVAFEPVFLKRALWMKEQMKNGRWTKPMLNRAGGPDRKTLEKILNGYPVRESILDSVVETLSKRVKVTLADVPNE